MEELLEQLLEDCRHYTAQGKLANCLQGHDILKSKAIVLRELSKYPSTDPRSKCSIYFPMSADVLLM